MRDFREKLMRNACRATSKLLPRHGDQEIVASAAFVQDGVPSHGGIFFF